MVQACNRANLWLISFCVFKSIKFVLHDFFVLKFLVIVLAVLVYYMNG